MRWPTIESYSRNSKLRRRILSNRPQEIPYFRKSGDQKGLIINWFKKPQSRLEMMMTHSRKTSL